MTRETQTRTLLGLLVLLAALGINTFLEVANYYNEVMAWTVAAVATISVVIAFRMQRHATATQLSGLFAVPFVLMALGVLVWTAIG
jgi:hypothetical protein